MPAESLKEQLETLKDVQLDQIMKLLRIEYVADGREDKIHRILEEDETLVDEAFAQLTLKRKIHR